jgi:putative oxidoreductase
MQTPLNTNISSLILRVGFGLYMLLGHGIGKLQKLMAGGEIQFAEIFGLSAEINLGIAVFVEVFCAAMIIIGFRSRLFILPMIALMLVIVFVVNAGNNWFMMSGNPSRELAMMYLIPFLTIFVLGSGKYSLDQLIDKLRGKNQAKEE